MSVQMVPISADAILEQLGKVRVDHGKAINGLAMADVWAYALDSALTAARQKPAETAMQSQNLLRGYCRARLVLEEFQALTLKYKTPLHAPARRASDAHEVPTESEAPPTSQALVRFSPSATMATCASSQPAATSRPLQQTTKAGRFRPVAVEAASVAQFHTEFTSNSWLQWISSDFGRRARSMAVWAVVQIPLVIHLLWIMALLSGLYLLSRPRLMVRVGTAVTSKVFDLVTSSGVELLQ